MNYFLFEKLETYDFPFTRFQL